MRTVIDKAAGESFGSVTYSGPGGGGTGTELKKKISLMNETPPEGKKHYQFNEGEYR